MDNFLLQEVIAEISELLSGHRLGKIYQLGATDLILDFRLRDGRWLIISTDPTKLSIYLGNRPQGDQRSDSGFISLTKKYIGSARLSAVTKVGYDRVTHFDFEVIEETGKIINRSLVILLTGRVADVLLLEGSTIIASLRDRKYQSETYQDPFPPENRLDPFLLPMEKFSELLAAHNDDIESAAANLLGFNRIYARELEWLAKSSDPQIAFKQLLINLQHRPYSTALYSSAPLDDFVREPGRDDFEVTISPIPLSHLLHHTRTDFPSANQAAECFYSLLEKRREFISERQRLITHLATQQKKQRALREKLEKERNAFSQENVYQRYGELLLANLHQAIKTGDAFLVTDYYDANTPQISVPAANKADAHEAAEHYFKLARRARNGLKAIAARIPQIEREIKVIETLQGKTTQAATIDCLKDISMRAGLRKADLPPLPKKKLKAEEKISGVRRYRTSDGYEVMVGRSDRDNDYLTFRIAKSFDIWFHAADYPGSHVLLRNPQRSQIPMSAIMQAAQLAAKFSQARNDAKVAVNYCERKFVTKLKGFAPGQVRLSSFKTIMVEPREAGERIL